MSNRLSIARMGSKPFLDATAYAHNGHDYAWLINELEKLENEKTTKTKICEAMKMTAPTLDKYIFVINLERIQHRNPKREEVNQ